MKKDPEVNWLKGDDVLKSKNKGSQFLCFALAELLEMQEYNKA